MARYGGQATASGATISSNGRRAVIRQVLADRLDILLGDKTALDRLDEAARELVLARGPKGSADLMTVFASHVVALASTVAESTRAPDSVFSTLIRTQVTQARRLRQAERSLSADD
ncbi:hypothetical protein ACFP51_09905 [Streptomyces pratens]|uniref:Uncharacterized protein n=1 Tax=Streptomyces pratens TaxID=887456 RepID=A0ABW1MBX8_9ACTN